MLKGGLSNDSVKKTIFESSEWMGLTEEVSKLKVRLDGVATPARLDELQKKVTKVVVDMAMFMTQNAP